MHNSIIQKRYTKHMGMELYGNVYGNCVWGVIIHLGEKFIFIVDIYHSVVYIFT